MKVTKIVNCPHCGQQFDAELSMQGGGGGPYRFGGNAEHTPDQRDWIRKNYEALRAAGWRNPEASPSDADGGLKHD